DGRARIGEMRQDEARVGDVERGRTHIVADPQRAELRPREPLALRVGARQRDLGRVEVDAEDAAGRADEARQLEATVATAAADVEAGEAADDARALEQRARRRPHDARENAQSLAPVHAAADHVSLTLHAGSSRRGAPSSPLAT